MTFNEEVEVKTVEDIPEVTEIDEVREACRGKSCHHIAWLWNKKRPPCQGSFLLKPLQQSRGPSSLQQFLGVDRQSAGHGINIFGLRELGGR